ncbi:hypothetical protein CONLIGDRAFT_672870 [Coniochaeta ligniaria NRRL 30616]|uniref:Uncharacterized protein n=1 Tax=Coniochaeta ligniaria NRRL 30616 TaxID=1408157 RepID=A0A1J7JED2_9PEZI|nr:hypothetical protein CONLIGDRAFT_672870 [Coniochaeta ligniaria NRRL 30616]
MPNLLALMLCMATSTYCLKASFTKPCPVDLDICGWDLQAGYGYDQDTLSEATTYAGQDAGVGTYVYDSIYNCYPDGEVGWSAWCGGAGQCEPPVNKISHALCRGEPVDTGASPPTDGGSNEGGSDDGGIVWDPPIGSGN